MAAPDAIKETLERNVRVVTLRPSVGQGTAVTRVRLGADPSGGRNSIPTDDGCDQSFSFSTAPPPAVRGLLWARLGFYFMRVGRRIQC